MTMKAYYRDRANPSRKVLRKKGMKKEGGSYGNVYTQDFKKSLLRGGPEPKAKPVRVKLRRKKGMKKEAAPHVDRVKAAIAARRALLEQSKDAMSADDFNRLIFRTQDQLENVANMAKLSPAANPKPDAVLKGGMKARVAKAVVRKKKQDNVKAVSKAALNADIPSAVEGGVRREDYKTSLRRMKNREEAAAQAAANPEIKQSRAVQLGVKPPRQAPVYARVSPFRLPEPV